jgi:hypothetical protein
MDIHRIKSQATLELSPEHLEEYESLELPNWKALIGLMEKESRTPRSRQNTEEDSQSDGDMVVG